MTTHSREDLRQLAKPEGGIPASEIAFAVALVAIALVIAFSLLSTACYHGGPCSFASYWWGEILVDLSRSLFGK